MTKEDRKEHLAYLKKAYPDRYKIYKEQLDSDVSPLYMLGYTNDRSFRGVYRI